MAKGKYHDWLTKEGLLRLEGWARDGLTDEQIARNIGITATTLYDWKGKYPEIFEALKKGKEVVDYEVENALLKSALGYFITEKRLTKSGEIVETEKWIPPDTTAQIFWLKNRRPSAWQNVSMKDKKEQDARIEKLKAETARISGDDGSDKPDDGFIEALKNEVNDTWQD